MDTTTYPPLSVAIAVSDGAKAIAFYIAAFGAQERYRLVDPETGKIGHAEFALHGGLLMLSDEYPQYNKTPETLGGISAKIVLMCDDVDAAFARATGAGAEVLCELKDQFYGHRDARLRDPFGHEWMLSQQVEIVAPDEMQRRWDAMMAPGGCEAPEGGKPASNRPE